MKILHEADKTILSKKYEQHHQSGLIIDVALSKKYCYLAELTPDDFKLTLINSEANSRSLPLSEYPSLWTVVLQIRTDPTFLDSTRHDGGLNGEQVAHYLNLFLTNGLSMGDCMILDRDIYPTMNSAGKYYVIDGMHRLVGFGLATTMDEQYSPVQVYYCTDRKP